MIIQDKELNNRIFIDDSIFEGEETRFALDKFTNGFYSIIRDDDFYFNVKLEDGGVLLSATSFIYELDTDVIKIRGDKGLIYYKSLAENEMVNISNNGITLVIETCTVPKFMEEEHDNVYPKFDIHISDNQYKVKIYLNETEVIEIPYFKSHKNIINSLEYLYEMVNYLSMNPEFLRSLCDCRYILIGVYKNEELQYSDTYKYCMETGSIHLIDDDDTSQLVPWHSFFKLVIDGKWRVRFIDTLPE